MPGKRRLEYMPIDDLPSADRNPKDHDAPGTKASIDRFGFMEVPMIDERTGKLVAGHGRRDDLLARRDAGEEAPDGIVIDKARGWLVPVVRGWRSTDDDEAHAAGIALNRIGEGLWKVDELPQLLAELKERTELGLEGIGFKDGELDEMLHQLDLKSKRHANDVDPDFIPPTPKRPRTKRGDLWIMGDHRVLCGDSTELDDVRRVLDGEPIDFAFTSPPYNVGVDYEDNDDDLDWTMYSKLLRGVIECVVSELAPGRMFGWNIGAMPKLRPFAQGLLLEECGLQLHRATIWNKRQIALQTYWHTRTQATTRTYFPNPVYEHVWLLSKGKATPGGPYDPNEELMRDDIIGISGNLSTRDLWTEEGSTVTVGTAASWRTATGSVGKVHPAPFPVQLPQAFIGYCADRDAIVFDPFAGSGSTLIAAHLTGRRGYGVELSPKYCDVIAERYQRVTGDLPVLERTGKPVDFLSKASPRK